MFVHLSVGFLFHCKDLIHSSVPLLSYFSIYKISLDQKKYTGSKGQPKALLSFGNKIICYQF